MDWDRETVTVSNQLFADPSGGIGTDLKFSPRAIQALFRQFIREHTISNEGKSEFHYRTMLSENYEQRNFKVAIDMIDLDDWNSDLARLLRRDPLTLLPLFEEAALEVVASSMFPVPRKEEMTPIQVQLINLKRESTLIRELNTDFVSQLVRVPGIVITASKPAVKATRVSLMCTDCKSVKIVHAGRAFGNILIPRTCDNTDPNREKKCSLDPFMVLADKSHFSDTQKLKLQEAPEDTPTGEMPRHVWLFCERNLVNQVKPGSRVNVVGVYKVFANSSNSGRDSGTDASVKKPYIEVIGFEELNETQKKGVFRSEEEEVFIDLSRQPGIQTQIRDSIAPAIWGNEDIKQAIACLLFGGSRKNLGGGMHLRGDINVLLMGDPSVAKSQFLKFVNDVAPICVYTSGKGSSAAGLTASVVKEHGEFHLEGGAMVLADGGVVCIDEFDKMDEQDRVAIHEAMEQQTISIAKAGITTVLNSRTSVLAAANPIYGRWDDLRTTSENIEFETTILSRFDLIFIIRDLKDRERDTRIAQHIMGLHIDSAAGAAAESDTSNEGPIAPELLAKYIAYARHKIHPRLNGSAVAKLRDNYIEFRRKAKEIERDTGEQSAIPLTVRQLESLVRLTESLAKMELSEVANERHVDEAIRLFKVATLRSAQSSGGGSDPNSLGLGDLSGSADFREAIQKAERHVRRRVIVGSTADVSKIVNEMTFKGVHAAATKRALDILHARGEIDYKYRKRQIIRKK